MFALTLAWLATFLTTAIYVPQVAHTIRSRKTDDLAWGTLFLNAAAAGAWLAYGILIVNMPIVATNAIVFVLGCWLLALKWQTQ